MGGGNRYHLTEKLLTSHTTINHYGIIVNDPNNALILLKEHSERLSKKNCSNNTSAVSFLPLSKVAKIDPFGISPTPLGMNG